jgi:hypothetical protein
LKDILSLFLYYWPSEACFLLEGLTKTWPLSFSFPYSLFDIKQLPPYCPSSPSPSLLHVGQQLAQQQGWGLHVHIQDLKSEQIRSGGGETQSVQSLTVSGNVRMQA